MSVKVSSDLRTQMFREDGAKDDARSGAFIKCNPHAKHTRPPIQQ